MAAGFRSLDAAWLAAMYFESKGPSAGLQFTAEADRIALGAFKAQALDGPMSEALLATPNFEDNASRKRREAWRSLGAMPRDDAKKQFLELLQAKFPQWKEWYQQHGQRHAKEVEASLLGTAIEQVDRQNTKDLGIHHVHDTGSLSDQILTEFEQRTGLSVSQQSRL